MRARVRTPGNELSKLFGRFVGSFAIWLYLYVIRYNASIEEL